MSTLPTTTHSSRTPLLLAGLGLAMGVMIVAVILAVRPAGSVFTPLDDGMVVEVDDGLLYFLWDGGRQRIQQPAAMNDDDFAELGVTRSTTAIPVLTVGEPGSRFVLHPSDGTEARLYLIDGETAHPVVVTRVDAAAVVSFPEIDELVVTRVRVP
jgi:hypothetical protein